MSGSNKVRIWLCDCGRIHLETKHCRVSLTPAEFLRSLRCAAGEGSTRGLGLSQSPALTKLVRKRGLLVLPEDNLCVIDSEGLHCSKIH